MARSTPTRSWGKFGEIVEGYDIEVFNEREVRASAGILFLFGMIGFMIAALTGIFFPLGPFALFFMLDMTIRLAISPRYSPTLALGRWIVRKQTPEFVGAPQKKWAWWLGLGMAFFSCFVLGNLGVPAVVLLSMCSLCLSFLFLETAFGVCVGCELQKRFSKTAPQYCPGDTCERPA